MAGSRVIVQPRDRRLLAALRLLRVIGRTHAELLGPFGSTGRANARLLQLVQAGHLRRSFLGTISGGRRAVYLLPGGRAGRLGALEHDLLVADVYCAFAACPAPPGVSLKEWRRPDQSLAPEAPAVPDGVAVIRQGERLTRCFVEVDRGTESLPVVERKIESYLRLALARAEGAPFRVVIATISPARLKNLCTRIAKRTDKLFWLALHSDIAREGAWAPVWHRPRGAMRTTLCDTAETAGGSILPGPASAEAAGEAST